MLSILTCRIWIENNLFAANSNCFTLVAYLLLLSFWRPRNDHKSIHIAAVARLNALKQMQELWRDLREPNLCNRRQVLEAIINH